MRRHIHSVRIQLAGELVEIPWHARCELAKVHEQLGEVYESAVRALAVLVSALAEEGTAEPSLTLEACLRARSCGRGSLPSPRSFSGLLRCFSLSRSIAAKRGALSPS